LSVIPKDFGKYLRVCQSGQFYETLMTKKERRRGGNYRRLFKERFFVVLFSRNKPKGRWPNKLRERFKAKYPTVAGVLKKLKSRNYRHSSHVLQNYEATIFIHRICRRLMEQHRGMPLVTLHDCLATTKEWVETVKQAIADEFAKSCVRPTLDVTGRATDAPDEMHIEPGVAEATNT
jgi:hypothetical protein